MNREDIEKILSNCKLMDQIAYKMMIKNLINYIYAQINPSNGKQMQF